MLIYFNFIYIKKEKFSLIKNIVLVGNGSHAKKRIIPSLNRKNIKIHRIFSSKNSLKEIAKVKNKKLFYYICTPPKTHFKIINFLLLKKQNIIVEKPAITKIDQFKIIKNKILKNKKNIFIENIMYKHSKIFLKLKNYWKKNKKNILKIEINFLIPNFFKIGFRSETKDKLIILHDIGIYPVSILNILGINILKVEIKKKFFSKKKIQKINIYLKSKKHEIKINVGENKKYYNNIIFTQSNGLKVHFDKIFSGIKTDKKNMFINKSEKQSFLIKDHDCFVKFFGLKKKYLLSIKKNNLKLLEKNILLLNRIKSKIKSN